jgi:hypothetical protein
LFKALEKKTDGFTEAQLLGILSYGISMTTLEEVFLKLGKLVCLKVHVVWIGLMCLHPTFKTMSSFSQRLSAASWRRKMSIV